MTFKLVSCDGGGIRGYLTCLILRDLQREIQFLEHADGFAGTSTGSLIAIALADGRSQGKDMTRLIEELVTLYRDDARKIFRLKERTLWDRAINRILKAFGAANGPGITAARYDPSGLEEVARSLLGERTFSSISNDFLLAVNTICLSLNDKIGWCPITMTNLADNNNNNKPYDKRWLGFRATKLVDAAMASAAAPTYFPPHHVSRHNAPDDHGYFVDGGLFANNPVMEAVDIATASGRAGNLEEIEALSVGTGAQPLQITEEIIGNPRGWGMLKWFGIMSDAPPGALLDLAMTTSAENQHWVAKLILKERYVRLNPSVSKRVSIASHEPAAFDAMDRASCCVKHTPEWKDAVAMLKKWKGCQA